MSEQKTMRRNPLAFLSLSAVLILSGCALQPAVRDDYPKAPTAWPAAPAGAQQASTQDARWWRIYADPQLDHLVAEALANNADLAISATRIEEARAQAGRAESRQQPAVNAVFTGGRNQQSSAAALGGARVRNAYRGTLEASYELDLWGRLAASSAAARAELLAEEHAAAALRQSLVAEVVQAYHALQAADAQLQVLDAALEANAAATRIFRQRVNAGQGVRADLLTQEADRAALQARRARVAGSVDTAEAALAVLLGRPPAAVLSSQVERAQAHGEVPLLVPGGLPSELLLRRPDLQAAEARLAASNARITVARAGYFPSIALTAVIGGESSALGHLFSGPAGIFQFAAALTQPIWNAGDTAHAVAAATARREGALAQYQQVVAQAFADVRSALAAQQAASQVLAAEGERVRALATAREQVRARLQAGVAGRLEYLDSERQWLEARLAQVAAEQERRNAVAGIMRALGGSWQAE